LCPWTDKMLHLLNNFCFFAISGREGGDVAVVTFVQEMFAFVAIGKPMRQVRKASHCGSKQ